MVNLYDSYQQSKVMNIIPDNSKELLRMQKENMAVKAATEKEIDDLTSMYNIPLASKKDASIVANKFSNFKSEIASVMSNSSLNPYEQYDQILKIKRKAENDRDLFLIADSNKAMLDAQQKANPELESYFKKNVYPDLQTDLSSGVRWSGSFDVNPSREWESVQSQLRSSISEDEFKDEKGVLSQGKREETIRNYINDNVNMVLSSNRGIALQMANEYEKSTGRSINLDNPSDVRTLQDYTAKTWIKMNEQYDYSSKVKIGNGLNVNVNMPKLDSPSVPMNELMEDPTVKNYISSMAVNVGAKKDNTGAYVLEDVAAKVRDRFKQVPGTLKVVPTKTITASSTMQADNVFKSGAQFSAKNKSNTQSLSTGVGTSKLTESEQEQSKEVYLLPDLTNSSLFGSAGSMSSEIYAGSAVSEILRKASDKGSVFMEPSSITSQYSFMHDGTIGNVARVTISSKSIGDSGKTIAEELFGRFPDGNGTVFNKLNSMTTPGKHILSINTPNGPINMSVYVDYMGGDGKTDPGTKVYSFDVIKSAAPLYGRSLSNFSYNTKYGKQSSTDYAGGMTSNYNYTLK